MTHATRAAAAEQDPGLIRDSERRRLRAAILTCATCGVIHDQGTVYDHAAWPAYLAGEHAYRMLDWLLGDPARRGEPPRPRRPVTIAGDHQDWLCCSCQTVTPRHDRDLLARLCPSCGAPLVPSSPNLREIDRLRALLAIHGEAAA